MTDIDLLHIAGIPVYQNKMFDSEAAALACPAGDVLLAQDTRTGLVRNRLFDSSLLHYDSSYQNEQGHSPAFKAHMQHVRATVGRHFKGLSILEIGCGKGSFLELLRAAGHDAHGIDPAYEGDSEFILRRPFEPGAGVRGDAIVMRHVLEHIPEPFDFLGLVKEANGGRGLIYIEVPCLDWILRNQAWFDVFYEHVNYFRLADFERMFGTLIESGTAFGGQYIYVVAELVSLRAPGSTGLPAPAPVGIPPDFFASLERCVAQSRPGVPMAVWGAAAKGVMFTHYLRAGFRVPAMAIDINPAKQGRFLAGSGLPVVSPSEAFARLGGEVDVFVMNSNYLSEIQTMGGPGPNYIAVDKT